MDRQSQEPASQPEDAESPLSFPVEAPRPSGPEPGAGAPADPLAFPAEVAPVAGSPVEAARWQADSLVVPAAATPLASSPLAPAEASSPSADPPAFPATATSPLFPATATPSLFPAEAPAAPPPPFPVAELPGTAAVPAPVPVAEPEPEPEPAPAPAPAVSWLLRLGPRVLAAVAALLAVGGCFLPLFQVVQELAFRQGFLGAQLVITQTAWGHHVEISDQGAIDRTGAPVGILVIVAIIVLAVAASSPPDRGLARWLLPAGAAFTAGVVATIWVGRYELEALTGGGQEKLAATTEPGMWLLIVATALAVCAAVLAHLPLRKSAGSPGWADPALAYADTPTPPSGIAITVLPPEEPDHPDGEPRLR